jgi:hypothetical protein
MLDISGFTIFESYSMVLAPDSAFIVAGELIKVSRPFHTLGMTVWNGCGFLFDFVSTTAVVRRAGCALLLCERLPGPEA